MRERYIPLEKQSKKQRRNYFAEQRGGWNGVVPVTRVVPDKRRPSRKSGKDQLRREMD